MEITFKNRKLQKYANSRKAAVRAYGLERANKLGRRLDDIKAMPNLQNLMSLTGRCHPLKGNRQGEYALDLDGPMRLIFKPVGSGLNYFEDGGLDLASVEAVMILRVEDYHE